MTPVVDDKTLTHSLSHPTPKPKPDILNESLIAVPSTNLIHPSLTSSTVLYPSQKKRSFHSGLVSKDTQNS
ncbi:hypothetical protein BY996DRAFT_6555448 [Phakopsora pachyrhizi]|nr:hypothetical protein BY996DRAFT_6555448 [Phakopsora pachyrhizi]